MKSVFCCLALLFVVQMGRANNVNLSNVQIVNNGPDSSYIQFDLSWENSWRVNNGPANYDGVWVFFKYKSNHPDAIYWGHVTLHPQNTTDYFPEGLSCWQDSSNLGAMLYRSSSNTGTGPVSFTGIRLALYPQFLPFDIDIRGFAVEMVYIPTHEHPLFTPPYYIGDGNSVAESTNAFHRYGNANLASYSGGETTVSPNTHDDYIIEEPNYFLLASAGQDGIEVPLGTDNPFYPTGSELWCMKYEITQGAYRDFLNTLAYPQQISRTEFAPTSPAGTGALTSAGTARNYIEINTPAVNNVGAVYGCDANGNNIFDESDDGEYIACNFLMWPDVAAWLSWSGMCPMTEIQYERICRGAKYSEFPVTYGDFAWGDTTLNTTVHALVNANGPDELISNASSSDGNAAYLNSGLPGPLRNGIFATASSNRATSGASFYGVMELSGNLMEICVTMGNTAGRSYNSGLEGGWYASSRGPGYVDGNGNAFVFRWPGCSTATHDQPLSDDCTVTLPVGTILRGGAWELNSSYMRTSDRSADEPFPTRTSFTGGRGVIVPAMYGE